MTGQQGLQFGDRRRVAARLDVGGEPFLDRSQLKLGEPDLICSARYLT